MKIRVFLVDDDATDRYIVTRRLSKAEDFSDVMEASTGESFLESFFANHLSNHSDDTPYVVLMDINMPGMGGFETVEKLQRRIDAGQGPKNVTVLVFTTSENDRDIARARNLDIVKGFLVKPFDADDVNRIREMVAA